MSDTGNLAAVTRRWIDGNVALFVVIVVAGALLVIALITLAIYCCCCRKKKDHWKRERGKSKANDSHAIQIENPRGDSVDADSVVTATMRSSGVIEIQIENSQPLPQQHQMQVNSQQELVNNQREEAVSMQKVSMYMQQEDRPRDLELQQLSQVTPKMVRIEKETKPVRLPRTEVSMVAEVQSLQRVVKVPALRISTKGQQGSREHGVSIYQSDENEITIVDSDFSDYEDRAEDATARKRAAGWAGEKAASWESLPNRAVQLQSAQVSSSITLQYEDTAEDAIARKRAAGWAGENAASWETLPNRAVQLQSAQVSSSITLQVDEPPVLALDLQGREYIPAPSPSLEEMRLRREENLAELDVTLSVFEQQAEDEESPAVGRPQVEAGEMEGYVDEGLVVAVDRSQVLH